MSEAADWYPDPLEPRRRRWWDGTQWTAAIALRGEVRHDGLQTLVTTRSTEHATVDRATQLDKEPHAFEEEAIRSPLAPQAEPAGSAVGESVAPGPRPVPGWWLCVLIAGLGFLATILPAASSGGDLLYGFRSDSDTFAWTEAWPLLVGQVVLVLAGIAGSKGRVGLMAIGSGVAMLMAAMVILVYSFVLELVLALDDAGFGSGISPSVGTFAALGASAGSVALFATTIMTAGRVERTTTPVLLSLVLTGSTGYVCWILADTYFQSGEPLFTESTWLNIGIVLLFGPFLLLTLLPVLFGNAAASGLSGGFALPLAVAFAAATLSDDPTVQVGVTDEAGAGLAIVLMATVGVVGAFAFDRRLVDADAPGTVCDTPAPSPVAAWGSAAVAATVLLVTVAGQEGDTGFDSVAADPFSSTSEDTFDESAPASPELRGEQVYSSSSDVNSGFRRTFEWTPQTSAVHEIRVYATSGLDATLSLKQSGQELAFNDDFDGTDPAIVHFLDGGATYEILVGGFADSSGSYDIEIRQRE